MKKSILLLSAILICSCASRNVSTDIANTETKTAVTEVLKEETTSNMEKQKESTESDKTTVKNDVFETEEDVNPIDASKPVTKTVTTEGNTTKTVWENANVNSKSKSDKSTSINEKMIKNFEIEISSLKTLLEAQKKLLMEEREKNKYKKTEVINLLWLLLLLIIPFGYWVYKTR